MGEVLKKFGRYFLLDEVAQGGMAEIFRARLASHDGAGRLMVIKRIQAGFGANAEFLQMFKSEIKVTMGFNHPNIVQLYDFGEEQGQPYIAMELVDGKNLRQFMSRFAELKQTFPVELATFIIEQAASGLHYAHAFKDKITGDPYNIVHRDISPQNILISFEGNIKVIDFGIAKATTNSESTRAGVIKGKPSYLSPEQISGETLDGRSDIFALGAVLWELLTGRKLFAGENDLAVLKLIESCQTTVKPPSTLNPKVPKELDYIVLKTLAKQREKRYQSSEELQRALHKFLYGYMPEFNPSDLAYYAKDMFKNEIVEDRKRIQKLNAKVEQILTSDIPNFPTTEEEEERTDVEKLKRKSPDSEEKTKVERTIAMGVSKVEKVEIEANSIGTVRSSPSGTSRPNAPTQRAAKPVTTSQPAAGKIIVSILAAIAVISIFGPEMGIQIPGVSDLMGSWVGGNEARLVLQGNQKGVVVAINGNPVASALPTTLNGLSLNTPFRVTVSGPGGSFAQEVTLQKGEKKVLTVTLNSEKGESAASSGLALGEKGILLKLNLIPGGGSPTITVSGRSMSASNPSLQVPLDSPLELSIERVGFRPFKREFVLESRQVNGLKEWLMDVQMEPISFGFLSIHTTPSSDASIPLESGSPWKRKTPIENEKLPVGKYTIRLNNDVLGMEKIVDVTIEEGKVVNIDEKLEIVK